MIKIFDVGAVVVQEFLDEKEFRYVAVQNNEDVFIEVEGKDSEFGLVCLLENEGFECMRSAK